jgi:hypothetical protein
MYLVRFEKKVPKVFSGIRSFIHEFQLGPATEAKK